MSRISKGLLISDFNVQNLSAYLKNDSNRPLLDCQAAPYGQVTQSLFDAKSPLLATCTRFCRGMDQAESVLEVSPGPVWLHNR